MNDREHQEQVALFLWARNPLTIRQYPGLDLLHAIPNKGYGKRGEDPRRAKREGARRKAEGRLAGIPDINLPVAQGNYHGLYIELKAPKGRATASQKDILGRLAAQGYLCVVCWGWWAAKGVIESYYDPSNKWPEKDVEIITSA
jgi:hypothetical protein